MKPMNILTIDIDLLIQSMRDLCRASDDYYLNKRTGTVISLSRKLIHALSPESSEDRNLNNIPEWDASMIPLAREIILMGSSDYLRIPEAFGRPEHEWMKDFSDSVRGPKLREKLIFALRGRGAGKRFKEILKEVPEEANRWLVFRKKKWEEKIQDWLEVHGVLAVIPSPKPRSAAA